MDARWPLAALTAGLTMIMASAAFAADGSPPPRAGWHGREIRAPRPAQADHTEARFPRGWSAGSVGLGTPQRLGAGLELGNAGLLLLRVGQSSLGLRHCARRHIGGFPGLGQRAGLALVGDAGAFGVVEEDRLVAGSVLSPLWGWPADVGVLVAPDARGRGLGARVAAAALASGVATAGFAAFRTMRANASSTGIAAQLGLEAYGANLLVPLEP